MTYDRFDIVDAHYWWNAEHHEGQWSSSYERLCRISQYFKPSAHANRPDSDNARAIYSELCDKAECTHQED